MAFIAKTIVIWAIFFSCAMASSEVFKLTPSEQTILRSNGIIKRSKAIQGTNLREAMAIGIIDAPREAVWDVITDYAHYKDFMPRTAVSIVTDRIANTVYFYSELIIPLLFGNVSYEIALVHDKKHFTITWDLVPGTGKNVKEVRGSWKLEHYKKGKTKAIYTLFTEPDTIIPDFVINILTDQTLGEIIQVIRDRVQKVGTDS